MYTPVDILTVASWSMMVGMEGGAERERQTVYMLATLATLATLLTTATRLTSIHRTSPYRPE